MVCSSSDERRQNKELTHTWDNKRMLAWEQGKRGEPDTVWACQTQKKALCGKEDAGNEATRQEEEKKTRKEIYGCSGRRHAGGGCDKESRIRPGVY